MVLVPKPQPAFDGEFFVGLTPAREDATDPVASANRTALNNALQAQYLEGVFAFANNVRVAGTVDRAISLAPDEYYTADGPIETHNRHGGALIGYAPVRGYYLASGEYDDGALGGNVSRITRVDGTNVTGDAVLRLRGTAFTVAGLELRGRPWTTNANGGQGPETGTRTYIGIEVEGRSSPASGRHLIQRSLIGDCRYGIYCRAGYWSGGSLQGDEQHADMGVVDNCMVWGCDSVFRSENQQSVNWVFRALEVEGFGGINEVANMIVFDIVRGGNVHATECLTLNYPRTTVIRVEDFSPWSAEVTVENLKWDRYVGDADYFLTLFEYGGDVGYANVWYRDWRIRITGHIAYDPDGAPAPDMSRLLVFPPGCNSFPLDDLLFDIQGLEDTPSFATRFTAVGSGPWYKPSNYWTAVPSSKWSMSEGSGTAVADSGVANADGTITGSVSWTTGHGGGNALAFTAGSGNYVNIPDVGDQEFDIKLLTRSTISFWIKLASYTNGVVLSKFHTTGSVETGFRTEASGSHFYVTENATNHFDIGSYVAADGNWDHVALTIDENRLATIYVNGTSRGTATFYRWFDNTSALRFGAPTASLYTSGTAAADMTLDDVRFYMDALTATQIGWLADGTL